MKNPYAKIKLFTFLAYGSILLSLCLSILPAWFLMQAVGGSIGAVLFGLCMVLCTVGLSILSFRLFGRLIQKQNANRKQFVCIKTAAFSRAKFVKNNSMDYVHEGVFSMMLPGKAVRTLSLFILSPETTGFDLKRMQKLQRDHVLKDHPQAKKKSGWPLRIQVLVLENASLEDFRSSLSRDSERMYAQGQIRCLYDNKNKKLYLPVFPGRRMSLTALLHFEQTVNVLSELLQAKKIEEV